MAINSKLLPFITALFLAIPSPVRALEQIIEEPVESTGRLFFRADTFSRPLFPNVEEKIEIGIPSDEIEFVKKGEKLIGKIQIDLELYQGSKSKEFQPQIVEFEKSEAKNPRTFQEYIFTNPLKVSPGDYKAKIKVTDLNHKRSTIDLAVKKLDLYVSGEAEISFTSPKYSFSEPMLSDIRFTHSTVPIKDPLFSDTEIKTNPSRMYGFDDRDIQFEFDVFFPDLEGEYKVDYNLRDSNNRICMRESSIWEKPETPNQHFIEATPTDSLDSGRYTIHVTVTNLENNVSASTSRFFDVIHSIQTWETPRDILVSFYKYKLHQEDTKILETGTPAELEKTLDEYWQKEYPKIQERVMAKAIFLSRVNYIEENFSHANTRGINTDQGRVYLDFGHPEEEGTMGAGASDTFFDRDEVDEVEFNIEASYERLIWKYGLNTYFVFKDEQGTDNWELEYTTEDGYGGQVKPADFFFERQF